MKTIKAKFFRGFLLWLLAAALPSSAQIFTVLHNFTNSPDGANPGGIVLSNGTLFGSSTHGGVSDNGMVYSLSTNGLNFQVIHDFADGTNDGVSPNNVILDRGTLYGSTQLGGTNSHGLIFKVDTNGQHYTILRSFTNAPAPEFPLGSLVLGGATLYGTSYGGSSNGFGTVFKIDTNGNNFQVLHMFTNSPDGAEPKAGLVLNGDTLYGTTFLGGTNGDYGAIFKLNTNGQDYSVIYSFSNFPAAQYPAAALLLSDGVLYGTTSAGGTNNGGTVFKLNTNGADYSMLHQFSGPQPPYDGLSPQATLALNGGILYGTTTGGGTGSQGTIFQIGTNGEGFMVLNNFSNSPDGETPQGSLTLDGKTIYGTTYNGGTGNAGEAFSLLLTPVITSQPQNQTATNGDSVTFSAAAVGIGTLNYQWLFNTNLAIDGATNTTLDLTNANLPGFYSMIAANNYGAATSSPALLTVFGEPILLSSTFDPDNGSYSFAFVNLAGSTNRLWATTNLVDPSFWRAIATNVMATNGLWLYTDANTAQTNSERFYRFSTP